MKSLNTINRFVPQSVFQMVKYLEPLIETSYKVKKALVVLNNKQQVTKPVGQTRMVDLEIRVTPFRSINSAPGVISDTDLLHKTDAALLAAL